LNNKFRTVETDDFVIMPNHFHGIVVIADVGADLCVGPLTDLRVGPVQKGAHAGAPLQGTHPVRPGAHIGAPLQRPPQPTTRMGTGAGVNPNVHPAHQGKHAGVPLQGTHPVRPVAQRNYYEHVIRDDESLKNRIREYILNNPAQWAFDPENPAATAAEPPTYGDYRHGVKERATGRSPLRRM